MPSQNIGHSRLFLGVKIQCLFDRYEGATLKRCLKLSLTDGADNSLYAASNMLQFLFASTMHDSAAFMQVSAEHMHLSTSTSQHYKLSAMLASR